MRFLKKARIWDVSYFKVTTWAALLGSACILVMVIYTTADVTGRYLLNKPMPASWEIVLTLMVFVVFLGLAYTEALGGHLRVEFLLRRFNSRGQAALETLSVLIAFILFAIIAWQAWDWTVETWQITEKMEGEWGLPWLPARLGFSVGVTLLGIQFIINIVRGINKFLRGSP